MSTISVVVSGYPGDLGDTTLWKADGTVEETQARLLFYTNDTAGGQSGGPVWETVSGCDPCVVAIHAYEYDPPTINSGVRITQEVYNFLLVRSQFRYTATVYLPVIGRGN